LRVSHRDRRVTADVIRSTWGMLGLVAVLVGAATVAPTAAVRFAAIVGLAAAGGFFLWRMGVTVRDYERDVARVRDGLPISGRILVEVESDVGFGPSTERSIPPSPNVRWGPDPPPPGRSDGDG